MALITYIFIHLLFANFAVWRIWAINDNRLSEIDYRSHLTCILFSYIIFILTIITYIMEKEQTRFFKFSPKIDR